jgi:hypothetical protein
MKAETSSWLRSYGRAASIRFYAFSFGLNRHQIKENKPIDRKSEPNHFHRIPFVG